MCQTNRNLSEFLPGTEVLKGTMFFNSLSTHLTHFCHSPSTQLYNAPGPSVPKYQPYPTYSTWPVVLSLSQAWKAALADSGVPLKQLHLSDCPQQLESEVIASWPGGQHHPYLTFSSYTPKKTGKHTLLDHLILISTGDVPLGPTRNLVHKSTLSRVGDTANLY